MGVSVDDLVLCRYCGLVYELGWVKRLHRYADCDVFETPCCKRQADTRPWVSFPSYTKVRELLGAGGTITVNRGQVTVECHDDTMYGLGVRIFVLASRHEVPS